MGRADREDLPLRPAQLKRGAVDAARCEPDEAESLAATTGAGADSALRRAITQLRAAIG